MAPAPVEPPRGRVRLETKHTLVAGGLSTVLASGDARPQIIAALDDASCVAGTVLYAASRLLLLYCTQTLAEGGSFSPTGLTSSASFGHKDNQKWRGTASDMPPGEAPVVFTQELVCWAVQMFKADRRAHDKAKANPAYQALERLVKDNNFVADLGGLQDTRNMADALNSLSKSLAVSISNHLNVATLAHTKLYLRAKYAHLYLSGKEVTQLAKTIGKSVQWNTHRTSLRGGHPYDVLPPHREQKAVTRYGLSVTIPEMEPMEWRALVDAERALLPQTWTQVDMLRGRFRMLRDIQARSLTSERPLRAFNLLPVCRSGRVFLKLNTDGLVDMLHRADVGFVMDKPVKISPTPSRSAEDTERMQKEANDAAKYANACKALAFFDQRKLQRLLRHPHHRSERTVELQLAGEFFRTDGVQAQFLCGTLKRSKRDREGVAKQEDGDDDGDAAVAQDAGADAESDDEDVVSAKTPVPQDIDHLFACDPGRTNLYTVVKARRVDEVERLDKYEDLAPLGDSSSFVLWDKAQLPSKRHGKYNREYLTKSAKRYDEECGGRLRRHKRTWRVKSCEEYRDAVGRLSNASLACVDFQQLLARVKVHLQCHSAIHLVEGSRDVAKDRFDAYIRKQKTLASIAGDFADVLGDTGILAWGGARWAVGAKGAAPCRSAMIYKHLKRQPFGNRIVTEAETNTSCKSAISQQLGKMVHPYHKRYCKDTSCFQTTWALDGTKENVSKTGKFRLGVFGGGRPHGLYLETEGKKRTCSRDINGASNIWRCYWERCHGRERPKTLQSSKKQGDASDRGRSA